MQPHMRLNENDIFNEKNVWRWKTTTQQRENSARLMLSIKRVSSRDSYTRIVPMFSKFSLFFCFFFLFDYVIHKINENEMLSHSETTHSLPQNIDIILLRIA